MSEISPIGQLRMPLARFEAILCALHDVAPERRAAFLARIKNLLRVGLLGNARAGRGRTTMFTAAGMFKVAIALECSQLGLGPEQVVRLINDNEAMLKLSIALVQKVAEGDRKEPDVLIVFNPSALKVSVDLDSTSYVPSIETQLRHLLTYGMYVADAKTFADKMFGKLAWSRLGIINVTHVFVSIARRLGAETFEVFSDNLIQWLDDADDPQA